MSNAIFDKHRKKLASVCETHDGKKAILQTWEAWRDGKWNGKPFLYKGKRKIEEDIEYEADLTRRVRNLYVRLENMKPIGDLEE